MGNIIDIIGRKFLLFDGAMGTMLQQRGLKPGDNPEIFNIEKPDIILDIHKSYIDAGADIITTNTFGANELKLKDSRYSVEEIIKRGIDIGRKAAKDKFIALDIGPTGQILKPIGTLEFEKAYEVFKRQIIVGNSMGVDLILIETMSDLYEMKAAILAAKENSNLPIFATMTFQDNKRTLMGTDPKTMVFVLEALGVDALGINCSLGPNEFHPIIDEILKYASIPVIARPNAGLPIYKDGNTIYNITPEEFSKEIVNMANRGVSIFGGCCGTNPNYIKAVSHKLQYMKPLNILPKDYTTVCSATNTIFIDGSIQVVGERINPTGKESLKNALINEDMNYVLREAIEQQKLGADILDINAGVPEIDESLIMEKMIKEIQGILDIPLQIDSSNPETIEKAVRIYNGKPIINSVTGDMATMESIFPIAKKYGANVIGLTMDEKGLPSNCEERVKICKKILDVAESYGIEKNNIIIDCLTLTASVNQSQAFETLNAIKQIKELYGVKTLLGVSNISFGLPNRKLLNRTFLTMALTYGLDIPILDPKDEEMMDSIRAFRVLSNSDKKAKKYISFYKSQPKEKSELTLDSLDEKDIKTIIFDGLKGEVVKSTEKLLETLEPLDIIDCHIIPALDEVGEKYERGDIFLPQLIQSAETVKKSFEIIKSYMKSKGEEKIDKGKIVLATVKGDIHDIGKNIVKILLENYGFEVIDLGKDVPIETIIDAILKHDVKLVGLSALMTTTVVNMEKTIKAIKDKGIDCEIMVGGAVLNKNYANMINADYYAKDAREAVKIAEKVYLKK